MQQRRAAGIIGPAVNIIHQDSNAAPATPLIATVVHRLTRLNTAIKSAVAKREEENSGHEGYRR